MWFGIFLLVVFVIVIGALWIMLQSGAGASKKIKPALDAQIAELQKLKYDELELLAKGKPVTQIEFEGQQFMRKLGLQSLSKGDKLILKVRCTLQAAGKAHIEESAAVTKQKDLG